MKMQERRGLERLKELELGPALETGERIRRGDITGALGTIRDGDDGPRKTLWARLITFLAIVGPGLIVMVGDNDAGAFSTYSQAGQDYGTSLLWTLLLLIPVLYVNQEMVLRLGAVTRVGHARLILERFGKFWGAFSVIDLFLLNALTIITEFIGISLALGFFGLPKILGICAAAALVIIGAAQGSFRRFERFAVALCVGSLLLIPVLVAVHAPIGRSLHDLVVPSLPHGDTSTVMLLICAIVGTTVAPWQLFFQQSYVIDKRITPRFINYERWDLVVGIGFVLFGACAMFSLSAGTFMGTKDFGGFQDAGAVASGIAHYVGHWPATLFALALMDAAIIGAAAVSLSTAYALGDVLSFRTSLHHKVTDAPAFYAVYLVLIALAAAIVLIPGSPLGLLTNAVQVLAGVLLPSATVFLLLLCNDKAVLGPWSNSNRVNVFTGVIIGLLVVLSLVLTCSTLFPQFGAHQIIWTLSIGVMASLAVGLWMAISGSSRAAHKVITRAERDSWHMPPLRELPDRGLSSLSRLWLAVLRVYLVGAIVMVVYKVILLALHRG